MLKELQAPLSIQPVAHARVKGKVIHDPWILSDEVLLQICRVPPESPSIAPAWLTDLRQLAWLIGQSQSVARPQLRQAMSLLASLLGQMPLHQLVSLPFGYAGEEYRSVGWIDRAALEQIGKQFVGMVWDDIAPESVSFAVERAVSEALAIGFLQDKSYDSWRPGMPSGSGWRAAVSATPYGLVKARALLPSQGHRPAVKPNGEIIAGGPPSQSRLHIDASGMCDAGTELNKSADADPSSPSPQSATGGQPPVSRLQVTAIDGDDPYGWARQAEIVRATNQVLGEGFLHKGVFSRECTIGRVATNGKSGRAARVNCDSFLAWITRKHGVGGEELTQLRNAIIGEIRARNP